MDFNNIAEIKKAGFTGFKKMKELFLDNSEIPREKGVYLILVLDKKTPDFLKIGSGGYFKGRNPNVSFDELKANWIAKTIVIYIGKAGGNGSSQTLQKRLKQYFGFGQGKNIGHQGGRYIWQLKNSGDLIVCWKTTPKAEPADVESKLIQEFKVNYNNHRPFANLKD